MLREEKGDNATYPMAYIAAMAFSMFNFHLRVARQCYDEGEVLTIMQGRPSCGQNSLDMAVYDFIKSFRVSRIIEII
jgi:hypothetical protein